MRRSKLRASKKSVFSHAFTPHKKVKFSMEGAIASMQAVDLEASSEIRTLLKPRRPVSEGAAHSLTEQEWEAACTYVQMLSTRLPELQEILFTSKTALSERLLGVEDELGAVLADLGTGEGRFREFLEQTGERRMDTPSPPFRISVSGNLLE
jgi:hypothetical protein